MEQLSIPDYDKSKDTVAAARARARLNGYVATGKEEGAKLFNLIKQNVITPYLIYTKDMDFDPALRAGETPLYKARVDSGLQDFRLHKHALSQMAAEVGIPAVFVTMLTKGEDWERRS